MPKVLRSFIFLFLFSCTYATPVIADSIATYKVKVATDLMNALKEARGILPGEKPYFFVVSALPSKNFKVAMAYPTYGEIYFEESAYDLCVREFGPDSLKAMSVILAHELVHFMRKHGVKNHFTWTFEEKVTQDSAFIRELGSAIPEEDGSKSGFLGRVESVMKAFQTRKQEAEADLEGGFLSYLAGYPIGEVGPKLMDKIYSFYGIDSILQTYPSLAERRQIAVATAAKLKNLQYWYEGANLMIAMGYYENALANYLRLLGEFQGREIYNNIGVIYMMAADQLFEGGERPPFMVPFSLDLQSRLGNATRGAGDQTRKEIRDSLLRIAITYFQKASDLDGEYPLALLNEGCAQWLHACSWKTDPAQSAEYLAKAKGLALQTERLTRTLNGWKGQERTIRSAQILQAMSLYSERDTLSAIRLFNKLKTEAPQDDRVSTNLNAILHPQGARFFQPSQCAKTEPVNFSPAYMRNTEVVTIKDYFWKTVAKINVTYNIEPGELPGSMKKLDFGYIEEGPGIMVYSSTWEDRQEKVFQTNIMWAPKGYSEPLPCDWQIGDLDMDQLIALYGEPKSVLPFASGDLYYFPKKESIITNQVGKQIGMDYYGLIVMVEDDVPVQWGLTLSWVPD